MRTRRVTRFGAMILLGATSLGATPPSSEPSAADLLFTRAREARTQSAYAHYVVYATVVRFRRGAHAVVSTWDTVEDLQRRLVHARSLPREEAAHPHVARGTNLAISVGPSGVPGPGELPKTGRILNPAPPDDGIGQLTF